MGLRINDGGRGGIDTSVADVFAKALFGDPDREMKFARLQSDLATDDYQRAQIAAHTAYNQALTDAAQWKLDSQKGAVGPAGKLIFDQENFGAGSGAVATPAAPVPVEPGVPIPAVRPIDSIVGPTTYERPDIQPLDSQPAPVELAPEPDFRISTYPQDSLDGLPETGPVPTRRPGDFPPFEPNPILTGAPPSFPDEPQMPDLPSLLTGVPRELRPPEQVPMPAPIDGLPVEYGPEGSRNPDRGVPGDRFREALARSQAQPPAPDGALASANVRGAEDYIPASRTPDDFYTINDVLSKLGLTDAAAPAIVDDAQALPVSPPDVGAGLELPTPQAPPAWQGSAQPDVGASLELPPPAPVDLPPELGLDMPVDETAGIPYPGDPRLDRLPPDLSPLSPDRGSVTTIPGRPRDAVPAPDVADMPVPVGEPVAVPGKPFMGPDVPPPAAPAQPEISDPHAPVTVVNTRQGPLPLTREEANALAQEVIANGGDVAGGLRTLAGTVGLTYGDMDNPGRMRIAAQLATGNLATTSTVVTEGDYAGVDAAARQEAAKPEDLEKNTEVINGVMYVVGKDAQGNKTLTKMTGSPNAKPEIQVVKEVPYQVTADANNNAVLTLPEGFEKATPDDLGGSDNEQMRVIRDAALAVRDPAKVITPEQAYSYALVHGKMSVAHDDIRQVEGPNGKETVRIPVQPQDLSAFPSVAEVFQRAGLPPPAAAPAAAPTATPAAAAAAAAPAPVISGTPPDLVAPPAAVAAAATPPADPNTPAPAPVPEKPFDPANPDPTAGPVVGAQSNGKVYGTGGYEIIVPGPGKDWTEFQNRSLKWLRESARADKMMKTMQPPPWYRDYAAHTTSGTTSPGVWDKIINRFGTDDATKLFLSNSASFINSEGRINSGAAIQPFENVELGWRFIDSDGDGEEVRTMKAGNRKIAMDGVYDIMATNRLLTPDIIKELKALGYDRNAAPPDVIQSQAPAKQPKGAIIDYDPALGHGQ